MSDWKDKIEAQIAELTKFEIDGMWGTSIPDETLEAARTMQALLDVAVAAEDDWEGAIANCGKYPESGKDCSAWIERGLRCSDCPTEVWMGSTGVALDKLRGVSGGD